ncbi:MAG: hypothetical protein A2X25_04990 [Chloroflexi bacterium GWB2_49_20]|nr:MAG: hypothetical protein A2X25_04990 [Chloroflexi bacterium GWB2_49_20]OGN80538.1 MAG: hypothetical protein A2X26_12100 [Chloroflexi bacterium GWC2_49_37]OGN83373.1 MAG: hypothetical protein A2X27_12275 [Chloroflexi bacterium GWD2_49_16]HCC78134.1 hypothetical protein [Anaerolineae bacterium]
MSNILAPPMKKLIAPLTMQDEGAFVVPPAFINLWKIPGLTLASALTGTPRSSYGLLDPCEESVPVLGSGVEFTGWPAASHHSAAL